MQDERERVEQILSGDMNAFREFIADYERLVCHIVFRMVKNEEDREEICQDVFIKAHRNLEKFEFKSKISTWIARIAYNTCINYLKKRKLLLYDDLIEGQQDQNKNASGRDASASFVEGVSGDFKAPDDFVMNQEMINFLFSEIHEMPVKFRTILTLYHLDELSYAEISEIMNLPEGTVKSYLFRARKLLKERMLEKYAAEELL